MLLHTINTDRGVVHHAQPGPIMEMKVKIRDAVRSLEALLEKEKDKATCLPIGDTFILLQKLANAEYIAKTRRLSKRDGMRTHYDAEANVLKRHDSMFDFMEEKQDPMARKRPMEEQPHNLLEIDKEQVKRRKLGVSDDADCLRKTKAALQEKEIVEHEYLAGTPEGLFFLRYILKRNVGLVAQMPRTDLGAGSNTLRPTDVRLLNLILNKCKPQMYPLVSHWLYLEYNLHLSRGPGPGSIRYDYLLNDFCNAIEAKPLDELLPNLEAWYHFVWSLPKFTERVFTHIAAMCAMISDPQPSAGPPAVPLQLKLVKDLILSPGHQPTIEHRALHILLTLTTHQKDPVKLSAIKLLVPELYASARHKQRIEDFAVESFNRLAKFRGDEGEEATKCHIGLLLRLASVNSKLLQWVFGGFGQLRDNCKAVLLGKCRQLFAKCLAPGKRDVQDLLRNASASALPLVQAYVDLHKSQPLAGALKQALIEVAKSNCAFDILLPLIPQLSQREIDQNKLVESVAKTAYPSKKEFLYGIVQNICKSTTYNDKLKDIFKRVLVNDPDASENVYRPLAESINICLEKKEIFGINDVLLPALRELAQAERTPSLLPYALLKLSRMYPNYLEACVAIVQTLIEREIWKNDGVWLGIVHFLHDHRPNTEHVIHSLPSVARTKYFDILSKNKSAS